MFRSGDIRSFFNKDQNNCTGAAGASTSSSSKNNVNHVNDETLISTRDPCLSAGKSSVCDLGNLETGPARPQLISYPSTNIAGSNRTFSTCYYDKFDWIEYSVSKDSVFCFACRMFCSNSRENVLTEKGLNNWKKIGDKLEKHAVSQAHTLAMAKLVNFKKPTESVAVQVSESHKKLVFDNRDYFKTNLDILLYLARQGMPFRVHDEQSNNKGNYLELCELFSKYDKNFKDKYERYFNLTGHSTQNEILAIVADEVLRKIVAEINEAECFSLMVDEAKSHKVQELCICVRYFHNNEIQERLIAMKDVFQSRTAQSLADVILPFLEEIGIHATMIGQSYDGASVMSGVNNGLQTIVRSQHPYAMYVHCLSHKLNLVIVNACKSNDISCSFFNVLQSLYVYFSSPDTCSKMRELQKEMKIKTPGPHEIHSLSDTRWARGATAVLSVQRNFEVLLAVLSTTADDLRHPKSPQAKGLLSAIKSLNFVVALIIYTEYLMIINVLSKELQRSNSCIAKCADAANGIITELESKRTEEAWEDKWKEVKLFCSSHDLDIIPSTENGEQGSQPPKKRPRMSSKKLDSYLLLSSVGSGESNDEAVMDDPEKNLKHKFRCNLFYPVLDTITEEMKRRFSDQALQIASSSEDFLRLDDQKAKVFVDSYSALGLYKPLLKAEMAILRNVFLNSGRSTKDMQLKMLVEELKKEVLSNDADLYPNVKKLLKISLTLPCNSATCERSFSAMRRINNWLRCSMRQERLSNLMLLFSESDIVKNLNYDLLADKWFLNTSCRKFILQ